MLLDLLTSLVRIFEHIGTSDLRSEKHLVEITWIFINCSVILVVDLHDLHSMNRMHPKSYSISLSVLPTIATLKLACLKRLRRYYG